MEVQEIKMEVRQIEPKVSHEIHLRLVSAATKATEMSINLTFMTKRNLMYDLSWIQILRKLCYSL